MAPYTTTQPATKRRSTGSAALRVAIWLLALVATAGAVMSIDKVLRDRTADGDGRTAEAVILPPPAGRPTPASQQPAPNQSVLARQPPASQPASGAAANLPGAIESAAKNVAAVTESTGVGGGARRDDGARDDGSPAFDIARIEPSGDAVIAGRASPGATVELLRNGVVHDRIVADTSGQFAMLPPRLPTGDSELTLRSRPPGGTAVTSKQTVVVAVQPNLKDQPVVALMAPDRPSVVLSKPEGLAASGGSVVVEAVESESGGKKLYVSGRSSPRASVRLYLNDNYQGSTTADASGRFTFTTLKDSGGSVSTWRVRLDEVDLKSGAVQSRAEVPFTQPPVVAAASPTDAPAVPGAGATAVPPPGAPSTAPLPKGATTVVSRGDTLWRLSSRAYGNGGRYMVIYDANHNQIRNPNRIYPGQVLMIPGKAQR
jgi:LysM repeat protein